MKYVFNYASFLLLLVFASCEKSNDTTYVSACSNLVTDTASTNDHAWIVVPNVFTPNGDGWNDVLKPLASTDVVSVLFSVFDNNDNVLFTTDHAGVGFSPTTAPVSFAVYTYRFQALTAQNHRISGCGPVYSIACLPTTFSITDLYFEDMLRANGQYQFPSGDPVISHYCP
ncbi:MAG: gliding motility-associated C-terminal domain-containing protein [Bacteroidetes bacterium]|nr:gliding motility-associated C-terminal domain-containing protein [Bacteroidota bacterium]